MKSTSDQTNTTKVAVMNAAERLFAARGFKSTSLRAITSAAGANLGAVNYHFASKDALILAVLARRLRPLNDHGMALLERFASEVPEGRLSVEKILEAMFRPGLELISKPSQGGRNFLRLMAFVFAEPGKFLKPLIQEQFSVKNHRFHQAFLRALPGLSESEAFWKMHFAYGTFVHTISHPHILEVSSRGICRLDDIETTLARVIGFCAAGFKSSTKIKNYEPKK